MLAMRPRRASGSAPFAVDEQSSQYHGVQYSRVQHPPPAVPPTPAQEQDAVNADLIAQKRRSTLSQQIREKEELLAMYRQGRSGDTQGLEVQLQQLRAQLDQMPQPVKLRQAPGMGQAQNGYGAAGGRWGAPAVASTPFSFPAPSVPATPASAVSAFSTGSGPGGARTRRDEVWERKYRAYLSRVGSTAASPAPSSALGARGGYGKPPAGRGPTPEMGARRVASNPRLLPAADATPVQQPAPQPPPQPQHQLQYHEPQHAQQPQQHAASNGHAAAPVGGAQYHESLPPTQQFASNGFASGTAAQHTPMQSGLHTPVSGGTPSDTSLQGGGPPQGARYGRRATPPASIPPTSHVQQQQQQHQQQKQEQSAFLNFGSDPRQGYGRRRQTF